MKVRSLVFAIAALAVTHSLPASAHPGGHDEDERLIPTTCAQLADRKRYTDDVSYPAVKELKERCDAAKVRAGTSAESDGARDDAR